MGVEGGIQMITVIHGVGAVWSNDYSTIIITAPGKDSAPWTRPRPSRPFLRQEPLLEAWQSSKSVLYIFHC